MAYESVHVLARGHVIIIGVQNEELIFLKSSYSILYAYITEDEIKHLAFALHQRDLHRIKYFGLCEKNWFYPNLYHSTQYALVAGLWHSPFGMNVPLILVHQRTMTYKAQLYLI